MKTCSYFQNLLVDFTDGHLGDAQRKSVDLHLADCQTCRAHLAQERWLSDRLCESASTWPVEQWLALRPHSAASLRGALAGPHPPCADGEPDGGLVRAAKNNSKGPIQLAWMVNKTLFRSTRARQSASPSRQAGWGRAFYDALRVAPHLLHHRGKLDGVECAKSKVAPRSRRLRRRVLAAASLAALVVVAFCVRPLIAPIHEPIASRSAAERATASDDRKFADLKAAIAREACAAELAMSAELLAAEPATDRYAAEARRFVAETFPDTKAGRDAARRASHKERL